MTTIFADANSGVMVADSKCSDETGVWYETTKIYSLSGEIVGASGSVKDIHTWLQWYSSGKHGPHPKVKEFSALCLREGKLFEHCHDGLEMLVERGYHGIGSGGGYALAAFMAGATPKKSVEIACQIDSYSGGRIVVKRVKK